MQGHHRPKRPQWIWEPWRPWDGMFYTWDGGWEISLCCTLGGEGGMVERVGKRAPDHGKPPQTKTVAQRSASTNITSICPRNVNNATSFTCCSTGLLLKFLAVNSINKFPVLGVNFLHHGSNSFSFQSFGHQSNDHEILATVAKECFRKVSERVGKITCVQV